MVPLDRDIDPGPFRQAELRQHRLRKSHADAVTPFLQYDCHIDLH
jgi:hypothetical protein